MSRGFSLFRLLLCISAALLLTTRAQGQTEPVAGLRQNTPQVHALVNARVVQSAGRVLSQATVVLRDGVIQSVGTDVDIPADARIHDYDGLTVYPGLIDAYSRLGKPEEKRQETAHQQARAKDDEQSRSRERVRYWNPMVRAEASVLAPFQIKDKDIAELRQLGFTAALVMPQEGIIRGGSALLALGDGSLNERVLTDAVAQHIVYETTGTRGEYPTSLMGAIALIRQALLDADWYEKAHRAFERNPNQPKPETNETLSALNQAVRRNVPFVFVNQSDQDVLRSLELAREFGLRTIIHGSGEEYRIIDKLKRAGVPVLLSVNFPQAPEVATPEQALAVSLQALQHWEAAPANPGVVAAADVPFALTTAELKKPQTFHRQIAKAIQNGLKHDDALAAVTSMPAQILGVAHLLGSVDAGKLAHLTITDGELFGSKTEIMEVWIDGKRHEITPQPEAEARGLWQMSLSLPDRVLDFKLELTGKAGKISGKISQDTTEVKLRQVARDLKRLNLVFDGESFGLDGMVRASGRIGAESLRGDGILPDGSRFTWQATLQERPKASQPKEQSEPTIPKTATQSTWPPGAFGLRESPPRPEAVLVRNATIWTSGAQGTLQEADLLVRQGKISEVGADLEAPDNAIVIDGEGKHVTAGLIDAHSHSGLTRGGNEVGQAVTAEVGIKDIINSHDIAFYRELAGGLTIINQLHGSANPIGGKNSVIKLRWGAPAEELMVADAIPGIKFALGENVKQSNWGDKFTSRYPQTRMGVEQIIRARFKAALDYERAWQRYQSLRNKERVVPPRKDLELETLLEILHGERLIHSHSYRQDEILMLVRIAEDFGFTIGTFQHVLEGYKVAEVLADHGAGASTFSDWWAYKFEVYDAIPYNGALMHRAGVLVSYNSDSNELARRMNLEAAKAVKYGGVPETEALKFVTINPARQLRIDHRVGSLEPGKDADFVIWNGHPLSTYTKCEQTWIDGRKYFDIETDREMRQQIAGERARIIQKILAESRESKEKASPSDATDEAQQPR